MMHNPLVTIIMPAYNAERTISKAIDSVLRQDYSNIELIVVNDGSTDNTKFICSQFHDDRLKVITQDNKGLSGARNTGLVNSNGEYVTFVDSDDWIEDIFISLLLRPLLEDKASLSICGMVREYPTYKQSISFEESSTFHDCLNNEAFLKLFEGGLINSCCNKLYRTDVIKNHKLLFSGKAIVEDIEFNLKYISVSDTISTIKACLYHYIMGNGSLTSKVSEDMFQNYMAIHTQFLDMLSNERQSVAHEFVYHQYISIFMRYIAKICDGTITKKEVYPILRKYINEPLIQQSFCSHSSTNFKEKLINFCLKSKLFDFIVLYYHFKQKR